jgi:RNA polymerase sigma-70 factor (ECF subfamily)
VAMPAYVVDDFAAVYAQHYRRLVVALCLSGASLATAEEIAQEAFVRTFSSWTRVRVGSNPPGYLYRSAFRLWRRTRQRDQRRDLQPMPTPSAGDPGSEATTRVALQHAFAALPAKTRTCAALALQSGLDTAEIARILRVKPATVRVHIHNARLALRAALADGPDPLND